MKTWKLNHKRNCGLTRLGPSLSAIYSLPCLFFSSKENGFQKGAFNLLIKDAEWGSKKEKPGWGRAKYIFGRKEMVTPGEKHRRERHPGRVGERGWTERWWCWWWCGWCDNYGWENSGKGRGSQGLLRKSCCAVCSVTISSLSPAIRSRSRYFSPILWELEVWVWVTLCVCVCVWTAETGPEEVGL